MTIWIVTTGNSDVVLKHDKNWGSLYDEVVDNLDCTKVFSPVQIDHLDRETGYTIAARVLGLVYGNQPDDYKKDLKFPLLDTYCQYIQDYQIKLQRIIVLLTDQSKIFSEEKRIYEQCPYWQDTCTLKPLLEWYFKEKKYLTCQPEFEYLIPESGQGLDHWNESLLLVKNTLQRINVNPLKAVYISHQAGTPAISSAVQFVSLGRFNKVKFLVSNKYFNDDYEQQSQGECIESSEYGRGIQIQKAKQLIISGFPGAALKVLDGIERINQKTISKLEQLVDFFNLHSSGTDINQDFQIPQATQRLVDSLDLINFFFKQKNYLQGISLLAGAQETFLKVAILSKLAVMNDNFTFNGFSGILSDMVEWKARGLFFSESVKSQSVEVKKKILYRLKFPEHLAYRLKFETNNYLKVTDKNSTLLAWLENIEHLFKPWDLLEYYCDDDRKSEDDLRNQYMHNLRGMEDNKVIEYLLGSKEKNRASNVSDAYNTYVKQPFFNAIALFKLPYQKENLNKKLQEIADSLI
jgi:hypothetical protein